jgi:putative oxidoreductase
MVLGSHLQRLFSTFPSSWPGFGLLLIRCSLGIVVSYSGVAGLSGDLFGPVAYAQHAIAFVGGIFLLAGLWTPVLGALVALDQFWISLWMHSPRAEDVWIHIFLAVVAVSVAMLGPGAWSIDALLFGREKIEIGSRGRRPYL